MLTFYQLEPLKDSLTRIIYENFSQYNLSNKVQFQLPGWDVNNICIWFPNGCNKI